MRHGFSEETAKAFNATNEPYQLQGNLIRKERDDLCSAIHWKLKEKGVYLVNPSKVWQFFARYGTHPLHGWIRVHFEIAVEQDEDTWAPPFRVTPHTIDAPDVDTAVAMIMLVKL